MTFLLKYLIAVVFFMSANCNVENSAEIKAEIQVDTIPKIETLEVVQIDSIAHLRYSWMDEKKPDRTLKSSIKTPEFYRRIETEKGSFADWLRHLPSKEANSKVHLYNGELKSNQSVHSAIVDIDVGKRDLQQCADAVMRLRAEYFYGKKEFSEIHFNYTSGDKVAFDDWMRGKKPVVSGNAVRFSSISNTIDYTYSNFKKYLVAIFSYAGTASLSKEMKNVAVEDMQIGDVFIQGGFPGHAIIVVDLAVNELGQKCFLLAQSYMPAQEIHILKNFNNLNLSPWYSVNFGETLYTPEWTFLKTDLKRFGE